eukprot:3004989-Pyramimonas_sp.AAC.1
MPFLFISLYQLPKYNLGTPNQTRRLGARAVHPDRAHDRSRVPDERCVCEEQILVLLGVIVCRGSVV